MNNTPIPWKVASDTCVTDENGIVVLQVNFGKPKKEYAANAEFIAHAANNHEIMLVALKSIRRMVAPEITGAFRRQSDMFVYNTVETALRKVETV
jgi:hypothetical protein